MQKLSNQFNFNHTSRLFCVSCGILELSFVELSALNITKLNGTSLVVLRAKENTLLIAW